MLFKYFLIFSLLTSCSTKIDRQTNWLDTLKNWSKNGAGIKEIREKNLAQKSIVKFELLKNEAKRVDIQSPYLAKPNIDYWYSCSIKLPKHFPIENKPLTLMQWISKPKSNLGETSKPPAMALHFVDGVMFATIRHSKDSILKTTDAINKHVLFELTDYEIDQWNDFIFLVKWTAEKGSEVRVWRNGQLIGSYAGPAGYSDATGPVFSFGIHRENTKHAHTVLFSDCREGKSYDQVDPNNYH